MKPFISRNYQIEMRGDTIYPICTITSLGWPHALRLGGEQRLQKLAQYHRHLTLIHLLQYCVITNQSCRSHQVGDEHLTSRNILLSV